MTAGLLDTDLLLAYREGSASAGAFVAEVRRASVIRISHASALAVLAWCADEDARSAVRAFLYPAIVHPVTAKISHRAFGVLNQLPLPMRLSPLDGFVAATALIHKLPLYSLDPERYSAVPGLTALPAR